MDSAAFDKNLIMKIINEALLQVWLFNEFEDQFLRRGRGYIGIVSNISDVAINALQSISRADNAAVYDCMISISDLPSRTAAQASEILRDCLSVLSDGTAINTYNDKLNALESLAKTIIEEIEEQPTLAAAQSSLQFLDDISILSSRIAFSNSLKLSPMMDKIIRDLEHIDEKSVLKGLYDSIRKKKYIHNLKF